MRPPDTAPQSGPGARCDAGPLAAHAAARPGPYVGRFAPSPTGPLHFGSLVAALGSWLDARAAGGRWLLRMEDVDRSRERPGAAASIFDTLDKLGLAWDGEVMVQSRREAAYEAALERLRGTGRVFACACTRREVADSGLARDGSPRYPGTCREGLPPGREARAWRLRTQPGECCFVDALQGRICEDLERDVGDFVLRRADGLFAYQLAVVVDDAEQGVTHIVRGADLLDSTLRQIYLQALLGYPRPDYLHLPVATNTAGEKLSKQTLATAIDLAKPSLALAQALGFLGQEVPADAARLAPQTLLAAAVDVWDRARLPRARSLPMPSR
ncbi:tRNA glutamyl-Q(34) synthetase GluQRS [Niveibacterium sp. SC-1]|uniref:tRNA glutamyl-Q(34) synthetase GluQRS n=1 Tax=Niveibacterium sp. SC-1 TaxID=3135646 RepID=UPI00311D7E20